MSPRLRPVLIAVFVLLVPLVAACGDDDGGGTGAGEDGSPTSEAAAPSGPTELDVTSLDYAYELSAESVPAGLVTVNQTNDGDENHQVTLVRLEDGQSAVDLADAIAADGDHATDDRNYAGGPNSVAAGQANSATSELEEGAYALICFIPAEDGEPHFAKGMVAEVEVTEPEGPGADPPAAEESVGMDDFAFAVPDGFTGTGVVEVTNTGEQAHELTVLTGDTPAGGLAAIGPGQTGWVELGLEPGDHQFTCFVSDIDTGRPHLALGMQTDLTIPSG
jgi:plastocyanin